uniref:Glucuronosyltransferase n=1 Tax=Meloidogyne floridensis TaxID=298350 RepID=A0A915PB61_9BILA
MLYAPWDFRCKLFRSSFLYVAGLFKKINEIKFIAINCNYYKGRCRSMYKLLAFPVIFAQTQYNQPIIFNQFLSSERLYRRTSLAFGLILNKTIISTLNITLNQLNIYSLNSNNLLKIDSFLINSTHKTQNVVDWINKCLGNFEEKIVKEIEIDDGESPSKSDALFKKLNSSTFNVVLFTNLIGLRQQSSSLIALKNIAKIINYCPSDSNKLELNELPQFSSKNNLNNFIQKYRNLCLIKEQKIIFCCKYYQHLCTNYSFKEYIRQIYGRFNYLLNLYCQSLKQQKTQNSTSIINLLGLRQQYLNCQLIKLLKKKFNYLFKKEEFLKEEKNNLNLLFGINCKLNKTFGFLTIDKRIGNYFMKKWGGNYEKDEGKDSIAIISREDEKIFWLKREGKEGLNMLVVNFYFNENCFGAKEINSETRNSISQFISNFLNSSLEWIPKNEVLPSSKIKNKKGTSVLNKLNFELFNEEILKKENRSFDAVIFFSGGNWHGPSKTVLHLFHQFKIYFDNFREDIKFYLFDASKNSLPWAYKFDRLPVVGFFPSFIPNESNLFPKELAFTFPNLIGFLLPRLNKLFKLKIAFEFCLTTNYCLNKNVQNIEKLILNINRDLKLFGKLKRRKRSDLITKYIKR